MQGKAQSFPRSRNPTPGPEIELIEAALGTAQGSGIWKERDNPILFREPALPTGFPDLVGVFLGHREIPVSPERLHLREKHMRLMHHLFLVGSTTVEEVAEALLWSKHGLDCLFQDLERANLVRRSSRKVKSVSVSRTFVLKRIVAVEAKVSKWEIALRQAVTNTWFASHSFILLPDRRWNEDVRSAATQFGIGVLTFDGAQTVTRLKPVKRPIPASYGSWLVNEWTIRQVSCFSADA